MLQNYLKTTLRILGRQGGSFFLNLAGLTLGISASVILFLIVDFHMSFDKFNTHLDRLYRVSTVSDGGRDKDYQPGVPTVLPAAFAEDFPEAEEVTFTSYRSDALVLIPQRNGEYKKYSEESGVVFAQPNFFKLFDRTMIIGNGAQALEKPNQAVISKELATKYFGHADAVGEVLRLDTLDFLIAAVMEDHVENTDLPFNLMLSQITIARAQDEEGWQSIWSDNQCYFLLKEGHTIQQLESRMPAFVTKYLGNDNWDHQTFVFRPLSELHFDTQFSNYNYRSVSSGVITMLSVIGLFLIITACINFINLTTAEAIKRSKEVGIRKTLGSTRGQLIRQFLGETSIVTLLAVVLSLGVVQLSLQWLNPFLDLELAMVFTNSKLVIFFAGIFITVAALSGLYPAFSLSGFKPVVALKNQTNNRSSSGYWLRKGLVAFQFVISQFFIFGTVILIAQMNFYQNKDLGFDKDAIITVPIFRETPGTKKKTLAQELTTIKGIEQVSLSTTAPSSGSTSATDFKIAGIDKSFSTQVKLVDDHYFQLFNLKIIAGTILPPSDTAVAHVVNETLVKMLGYENPEEIIGKELTMWGKTLPVVGVVKDFHASSLHNLIEPIVLRSDVSGYRTLSLKVSQAQIPKTVEAIKTKWESFYPEAIFDYEFLDERIQRFYESEQRMSVLLSVFTSLAIFIGCLGLFGLATFMINQKTKEIGVRKVLGASISSIIGIFSREYVKLIFIGFAIAAPLAWLVMNAWLDTFAYKITIEAWVFLVGISITLLIAIFTVGFRSYRAAARNPVKSLRYE